MSETQLTIVSKLSIDEGDLETLDVDDPFGVIRDYSYDHQYYLVRWPEEDDA